MATASSKAAERQTIALSFTVNGRAYDLDVEPHELLPDFEARGKKILTIEGLAENGTLHPLQQAFIEHGGFQCGFCTPGMILTAKLLLDENPDPTEKELKHFMHGNICRCTGYKKIVESILAAAKKMRSGARSGKN